MTKALSAKSNLGFVDGSILEPSNPDSPLFQASWRCNDMVIYFMKFVKIQNVRYIQRNGQRLLELKKLSLSLSHSRFTNCWRAEVFVRRISQLLNPPCLSLWSYAGYNISFKKNMFFNFSLACMRGQILLIKSIPTINKVFFPVRRERKQFVVLSILL